MTKQYAETQHAAAVIECRNARARMNDAKPGTRKWREAEEDLNFWQGKVANMAAALLRF